MNEPEQPLTGEDPSLKSCTSFKLHIRPLFTPKDIQHMNDMVGMDLDDYQVVKANADSILKRLKDPNNPMPPPPEGPWSPAWIQCFEQWIANGKQP